MEQIVGVRPDSANPTARERFQHLDALRGLAALLVVTRHSPEFWGFQVTRSYLAVDLFFLLSGFVIANAYDQRLAQKAIGVTGFMKIRLVRLYPLFALSLVLAIIPFSLNTLLLENTTPNVSAFLLTLLFTALLIPSRFTQSTDMFAMNGPYWSLLFELVTNIIYVLIRPVLSTRVHVWLVIMTGIVLAAAAIFADSLNIGFSAGMRSFVAGLIRATFGIFFGLLLYKFRHGRIIAFKKLARPIFFTPVCLTLFFVPMLNEYNGIIDFFIVSSALPFIVLLAANSESSSADGLVNFLGTISYPIYVFHQPLAHIFVRICPDQIKQYAPLSGIVFLAALSILSLLGDKYFDRPVRRFLTNRLIEKNGIIGDTLPESASVKLTATS